MVRIFCMTYGDPGWAPTLFGLLCQSRSSQEKVNQRKEGSELTAQESLSGWPGFQLVGWWFQMGAPSVYLVLLVGTSQGKGIVCSYQSPRGKAQITCKDFMFYLFIGCATWHVDLSSLTKDWNCTLWFGNAESKPSIIELLYHAKQWTYTYMVSLNTQAHTMKKYNYSSLKLVKLGLGETMGFAKSQARGDWILTSVLSSTLASALSIIPLRS